MRRLPDIIAGSHVLRVPSIHYPACILLNTIVSNWTFVFGCMMLRPTVNLERVERPGTQLNSVIVPLVERILLTAGGVQAMCMSLGIHLAQGARAIELY